MSIYVGTIDGHTELNLTSHIYVEEMGDYYKIEDGTPQFSKDGATLTLE